MKIKFWCDSGANIHSCREEVLDTDDLGMTDDEWNELSYDQKYELAKEWANDHLSIGFEEI